MNYEGEGASFPIQKVVLRIFLDAIASHLLAPTPVSQWVSGYLRVIKSFRFGDSYRISKFCELVQNKLFYVYISIPSLLCDDNDNQQSMTGSPVKSHSFSRIIQVSLIFDGSTNNDGAGRLEKTLSVVSQTIVNLR